MIKKLRFKLIVIIMSMITVLLVSIITVIYVITRSNLISESQKAMNTVLDNPSDYQSIFGKKTYLTLENDEYTQYNMFILEYTEIIINNKREIKAYGITQEELDANQNYFLTVFSDVMVSNKTEGTLDEYDLRYIAKYDKALATTSIIFLDKTFEITTLQTLVINLVSVGVFLFIGFLLLTFIITKITTDPIEESMNQQQRLVADISHELKTPLTVINANADIVMSRPDATVGEQMKWLDYIKTESSRMASLIQNMLYLAKSDESLGDIQKENVNFSDIAYETVLPFESICFEKNLMLQTNVAPNIQISGNSKLLQQLIVILMDNACKYSYENEEIFFNLIKNQDKVIMSVNNKGDVIPPDQLQKIFERFYRLDKSRARTEGGYGLGLSIAQSVARFHNAKISVKSTVENGTTFFCIFKSL